MAEPAIPPAGSFRHLVARPGVDREELAAGYGGIASRAGCIQPVRRAAGTRTVMLDSVSPDSLRLMFGSNAIHSNVLPPLDGLSSLFLRGDSGVAQ